MSPKVISTKCKNTYLALLVGHSAFAREIGLVSYQQLVNVLTRVSTCR